MCTYNLLYKIKEKKICRKHFNEEYYNNALIFFLNV